MTSTSETEATSQLPGVAESPGPAPGPTGINRLRISGLYLLLLAMVFSPALWMLAAHAMQEDLHSHVLLIPFICGYLLYIRWNDLPRDYGSCFLPALGFAGIGAAALVVAWVLNPAVVPLSHNDYLALMAFAFVCWMVAGGFAILGGRWMRAAAFPMAFMLFFVPLPDAAVELLETASKLGSAETTHFFFSAYGMPFLRDGLIFQLPNITLEVAQECSGIRSSWVLFITSLLASNLFLRTAWRRTVLVLFVIPLGLLRNGFRILVIGILCVEIGPEMIHSFVHNRGGPIFFALSLIPLFALLWWLRRGEQPKAKAEKRV